MDHGAIDLHKRESQVRIITADGEVIDRRILSTRERFTAMFWGRARMRILIEASTESEWVARDLEGLGHDVIVADPNYGAMYARRSRRVKTDRRDAAGLADACLHGVTRRRGKKVAMVARSAARPHPIAMWRDGTEYQAKRVRVINGTVPATVDSATTVM